MGQIKLTEVQRATILVIGGPSPACSQEQAPEVGPL
jgi:hypothetical protein